MRGVIVLLSCLVSASLAQEWTQELKDLVLQIHNDYRKAEGACQMSKLVYDEGLEASAKAFAEACGSDLLFHRDFGLNVGKGTEGGEALVKSATKAWYDEKEGYPTDEHRCYQHCHYTQMVWDRTTKIGCYTNKCEEEFQLVCAYSPRGNWDDQKPYQESCDTDCAEGQTPEDGLCTGEPANTCEDRITACKSWAAACVCQSRPYLMLKDCPKTCNFCGDGAARVKRGADCPNECEDTGETCEDLTNRGYCERDPGYMLSACKKSCGACWE